MIWLIGGTSESRAIAQHLSRIQIPWIATVVTAKATRLYEDLPGQVWVGTLTPDQLDNFLRDYNIQAIVDASHPFATVISQLAIATGLPYLRFERPELSLPASVVVVPNLDAVLQPCYLDRRRILLTLGVKALPHFYPWQQRAELWARVLPTSIQHAQTAGFSGDRLLAMQLPLTLDQERQLWQTLGIETVITKASGEAGGLSIKLQLAEELGTQLIAIARPAFSYSQQTSDLEAINAFCQTWTR
jgi:precorrin-6A/cobalt-precorrin-6A reductase